MSVFKAFPFLWMYLLTADSFHMFLCHLKCRLWGDTGVAVLDSLPREGSTHSRSPGGLADGQMGEETKEALVILSIESSCS